MVSFGIFNPIFTEIQIDSASLVAFMKKDLLHQLKIRDRLLIIEAFDQLTKRKRPLKNSGAP